MSHTAAYKRRFFTEISFSSGGETKIKGYHVGTKKNIFLCVYVKVVLLGWLVVVVCFVSGACSTLGSCYRLDYHTNGNVRKNRVLLKNDKNKFSCFCRNIEMLVQDMYIYVCI